jgi:hypothetical protein
MIAIQSGGKCNLDLVEENKIPKSVLCNAATMLSCGAGFAKRRGASRAKPRRQLVGQAGFHQRRDRYKVGHNWVWQWQAGWRQIFPALPQITSCNSYANG